MPGAFLNRSYHLILFSLYTFCKASPLPVFQFVSLQDILPSRGVQWSWRMGLLSLGILAARSWVFQHFCALKTRTMQIKGGGGGGVCRSKPGSPMQAGPPASSVLGARGGAGTHTAVGHAPVPHRAGSRAGWASVLPRPQGQVYLVGGVREHRK